MPLVNGDIKVSHTKELLMQNKQQRQTNQLWRERSIVAAHVPLINNFSSNDYLALSHHPKVISAFQQGLEQWGAGSGGSPLTTGYQPPHRALEEELCNWLGFESALLFNSGYGANQGSLQAARKLGITPILDRLCHASLYSGAGDRVQRFRHNDLPHLQQQLNKPTKAARLIVSEGLFSMDGDSAPFDDLIQLKQKKERVKRETLLFIDDAHGLGARGIEGRGSLTPAQSQQVDLFSATFGKALGCQGAFVGGSKNWIDYLVQSAGEYIYSTAMPAAQAYAVLAAIKLVRNSEELLQQRLISHIQYFRLLSLQFAEKLPQPNEYVFLPSESAIQPLLVGSSERALYISTALQRKGFACVAIRPPTVPNGKARLRFTVTLHQTHKSMEQMFHVLAELLSKPIVGASQ